MQKREIRHKVVLLVSVSFTVLFLCDCKDNKRIGRKGDESTECPPGAVGCACHPDGTCDPADGGPVSCVSNVCTYSDSPSIGILGGACDEGTACGEHEEGTLDCIAGMCELAGCPSGLLGCPCGPNGNCEAYFGQPAVCSSNGRCVITSCAEGTPGCNCRSDSSCNPPMACTGGICTGPTVAIRISNSEVRSCDILIAHKDAKINSVKFHPNIIGEFKSKSPNTAFSFISRKNESMSGETVRVELTENAPIEILSITCSSTAGTPVQTPNVGIIPVQ